MSQANSEAPIEHIHHHSYCLTEWEVLKLTGQDITDLLNRLLTLDVKRLEPGRGDWAFLLDHRGRVRQPFWLMKESTERYYAISERSVADLTDAIDMFVFGEDVSLVTDGLRGIYCWGPLQDDHLIKDLTLTFDLSCFGVPHERMILIDDTQEKHCLEMLGKQGSASYTQDELEQFRVSWGGFSAREYHEGVSPLDVSLQGISEGKGCYPGQEVIERTLALGKPARITVPMRVTGEPDDLSDLRTAFHQGDELQVYVQERRVGQLTSMGFDRDLYYAIAQLKRSAQNETLSVRVQDRSFDVMLTVS